MLKIYLDAANLDCQLMMDLFESFETITYDISTLLYAPMLNVNLVWSATRRILDWIQRQRSRVGFSFWVFYFWSGKAVPDVTYTSLW